MNLTKQEALENHRKMWNWIAVETLKRGRKVYKHEYFKKHRDLLKPAHECYCCEYHEEICYSQGYRTYPCSLDCPIIWNVSQGVSTCMGYNTAYLEYLLSPKANWKYAGVMAFIVANLPENMYKNEEDREYFYKIVLKHIEDGSEKPTCHVHLSMDEALRIIYGECKLMIHENRDDNYLPILVREGESI